MQTCVAAERASGRRRWVARWASRLEGRHQLGRVGSDARGCCYGVGWSRLLAHQCKCRGCPRTSLQSCSAVSSTACTGARCGAWSIAVSASTSSSACPLLVLLQ